MLQPEHAHDFLDRTGEVSWQRAPGFVWYIWSATTVELFTKDIPATTASVDEVSTAPDPFFPSPRTRIWKPNGAQRSVVSHPQLQLAFWGPVPAERNFFRG